MTKYVSKISQSKYQDLWLIKCMMTLHFTDVFTAADHLWEKMWLKIKQQQDLLRSVFRFSNRPSAESHYKSKKFIKILNVNQKELSQNVRNYIKKQCQNRMFPAPYIWIMLNYLQPKHETTECDSQKHIIPQGFQWKYIINDKTEISQR